MIWALAHTVCVYVCGCGRERDMIWALTHSLWGGRGCVHLGACNRHRDTRMGTYFKSQGYEGSDQLRGDGGDRAGPIGVGRPLLGQGSESLLGC